MAILIQHIQKKMYQSDLFSEACFCMSNMYSGNDCFCSKFLLFSFCRHLPITLSSLLYFKNLFSTFVDMEYWFFCTGNFIKKKKKQHRLALLFHNAGRRGIICLHTTIRFVTGHIVAYKTSFPYFAYLKNMVFGGNHV